MAAKATVNNDQTETEPVINRWIVDYYVFQALESFRRDQYEDFCSARDILQKFLERPMERTNVTETKIRVMEFLSRINDGDNLESVFECDESVTPLESALIILEKWREGISPHEDSSFEKVCTSVKEMTVGILIKNSEFDKAREVLNKHFPRIMVGKKATFMGLVMQKKNTHKIIQEMDFKKFKEEMLDFCKKLCTFDIPFLQKAAKQAIDKRLEYQDNMAAVDRDESGPSSTPQHAPWKYTILQMTRLKTSYQALMSGSDEKSFAQLVEEVESEGQTRKEDGCICLTHTPDKGTNWECVGEEGLFQRQSGSPMEASPADQPPQTDAVVQTQPDTQLKTPSVAQLVIQPDSQSSSQCTIASQELKTEVRNKEPSNRNDLQCPVMVNKVSPPVWKLPRREKRTCSRASTSWAELSEDSEEDPPVSVGNGEICVGNVHNRSLNRSFTRSKESLSESKKDPQKSCFIFQTPEQKQQKRVANKNPGSAEVCIIDSLDNSLSPQKSSTPHKASTQHKDAPHSKWRKLFKEAKETKETWSDEESYVNIRNNTGLNESIVSNSGHRKRKWTDSETEKLKEGVKRFGEGSWSKIKAYYKFQDRTNVNLKDRWRTMKKLDIV